MTIIFDTVEFWIESIETTIPFIAVDTVTDSAVVNLKKGGRCVGWSVVTGSSTSTAPIVSLLTGAGGVIPYGTELTSVMARGITRLGNNTTNIHIIVYMRR